MNYLFPILIIPLLPEKLNNHHPLNKSVMTMKIAQLPSAEEINMLFQDFKIISNGIDNEGAVNKSSKDSEYIVSDKNPAPASETSALEQLMKMEGLEEVKEAISLQLSYS